MTQDLFYDVKSDVLTICENLHYDCSFDDIHRFMFVYGRLGSDYPIITSHLLEVLSNVSYVHFNSVMIDSKGKLCAFFYIDD